MNKNTGFTKLCKDLEKESKKSATSEIALTRQKVQEFIGGDRDKYIQLKAEADFEPSSTDSMGYVFSLLGFAVAALAFLYSVTLESAKTAMSPTVTIALLIELFIALHALSKIKIVNKWRKYILAVMNEFNPEQFEE
mgnify:FL=1